MKAPLIALLMIGAAYGQDAPNKPLEMIAVAAIGVDAWATNRNMMMPKACEYNPIARPFVTHGPALTTGYFAIGAAGFMFADRKLAQHHKRMSRMLEWTVIGVEGFAAGYSIHGYRH